MGPRVVRFMAKDPTALLDVVRFWEVMDARMRQMRDSTALPRSVATLPDEFDGVVAELYSSVRTQAEAARDAQRTTVEITFPASPELRALIEWSKGRMEIIEGLVRSGMIAPEWERPLTLTLEFWQAAIRQLANAP